MATASLVLGIASVAAAFMQFAFLPACLAILFGGIARAAAKHGATGKKTGTWGLGLGITALVLSVVGMAGDGM